MIRNEKEYTEAVERIRQEKSAWPSSRRELKAMGLGPPRSSGPSTRCGRSTSSLEEEVRGYERLKRGEFDEVMNLRGLGQLLVSLRIAKGLTQRQLAERLGVHETQVSRDERNEYHGITLDRAARILEPWTSRCEAGCNRLAPSRPRWRSLRSIEQDRTAANQGPHVNSVRAFCCGGGH